VSFVVGTGWFSKRDVSRETERISSGRGALSDVFGPLGWGLFFVSEVN